ncbi:MAG TPA: L,D-transpeptidase [Baekduia sp.]|nr:L,D-transpeptidase [Baekduia sp.]
MPRRARSWAIRLAAVLLCAAAGLALRTALSGGGERAVRGAALPVEPVATTTGFSTGAAQSHRLPPHTTLIATARSAAVRVHRRPRGGKRGSRVLHRRTIGGRAVPLTFLVVRRRPGWVRVALPTRPNGAEGWLRRRAVRLTTTRLSLVVDRRAHRLVLRDGRRQVLHATIGVGRAVSPTPRGRYFVTDVIRTDDPAGFFGPYALGLSAHSQVYTSFDGGDGQVGIHGTNRPDLLGHDVSHGCIRVRNAVIRRLAHRLPLGTPVVIR